MKSPPILNPNPKYNHHGYTLLETVISLVILMAVVVPLLTVFYRSFTLTASQRELEGVWLIEQEAALAKAFPRSVLPVKRRYVEGREWTIRTDITGTEPRSYRLTAELKGKTVTESRFYARTENAER